jgi:hypothetical protein
MAVRLSALRPGRPLPPGRFLVHISVGGRVDPRAILQLDGLCKLKNPVTSSGIEPVTFRFVTLCLNQVRHAMPPQRRLVGRLMNNELEGMWEEAIAS